MLSATDSNSWIVIDRQPRSPPKEWARPESTQERRICYFGNRCLRLPNCPYLHTEENMPNYEILSTIECPRGDSCMASDCWYAHSHKPAGPGETIMQLEPVRLKSRAERRAERQRRSERQAERRRPESAGPGDERRRDNVCTVCALDELEARELEERLRVLCGDSPEL
jgi:hypothetical protein